MLRFGLLMCVCLFFLGCALLFAFGSAGSPCFLSSRRDKVHGNCQAFRVDGQMTTIATTSCQKACSMTSEFLLLHIQKPDTAFLVSCWPEKFLRLKSHPLGKSCCCSGFICPTTGDHDQLLLFAVRQAGTNDASVSLKRTEHTIRPLESPPFHKDIDSELKLRTTKSVTQPPLQGIAKHEECAKIGECLVRPIRKHANANLFSSKGSQDRW